MFKILAAWVAFVGPAAPPAPTAINAHSSPNPSAPGVTVTVSGNVQTIPPGFSTPTGQILLTENSVALLQPQPVVGGGNFSISLSGLAVGTHNILVTFSGSGSFMQSQTPVLQIVGATMTTVSASPSNPQYGTAITLTAVVTASASGSPTPQGSVAFNDGSSPLGTKSLAGSSASIVLPTQLLPGPHQITAVFTPSDGNSLTSTSSILNLSVLPAATSVTATASPNPANIGQPITLNITVAQASGAPKPTGTVSVKNSTQTLATAQLSNGSATATVTLSKGGNVILELDYSGDAIYAPAIGSIEPAGNQITSTLSLTANPASITFGQSVTMTAQVGPSPPIGASAPTGQVQFSDENTGFGPALLANATASLTIPNLPGGSHQFSASYAGDASWTSSKATATVVVNRANSSLNLTSNVVSPFVAQSVTLTATLGGTNALIPPGGTVQFADGAHILGSATASSGKATLAISFSQAGSHALTATYAGDSNYLGATGSLTQNVNPLTGALSLSYSPASATFGETVTLSVTLSAPAAGNLASPTGLIQILDGSISIGSFPVTGSGASTTISSFSPGAHALSATYGGDANWQPAQSGIVIMVIGPCPTTTTIASSPASATDTQMTLVASVAPGHTVPVPPTGAIQFSDQATGTILATSTLANGSATATVPVTSDPVIATYSGDNNFATSTSAPLSRIAVVNAAAFTAQSFAPDELVSIFGSNLGTGGTSVNIVDASGIAQPATLFYAGPTQINLAMPTTLVDGAATLTVTTSSGATFRSAITVARVAPGIFSADASGQGQAAAQILRVHSDGSQTVESVAGPIVLGTDPAYLVLYGTGIRRALSVICDIGSQSLTPVYAGPQPQFQGLDQIDVLLPAILQGGGKMNVSISADGKLSNTVTLVFQ